MVIVLFHHYAYSWRQGRTDLSGVAHDGPIAFWADATAAIHYEKINKLGEDERKDCASFSAAGALHSVEF